MSALGRADPQHRRRRVRAARCARDAPLRRLQVAWVACSLGGWAFFVALSVYAYEVGGASLVGVAAVVRMAPAALAAPATSLLGDRHSRRTARWCAHAVLAAAACCGGGRSGRARVRARALFTAIGTGHRPAQAALLPALADAAPARRLQRPVDRGRQRRVPGGRAVRRHPDRPVAGRQARGARPPPDPGALRTRRHRRPRGRPGRPVLRSSRPAKSRSPKAAASAAPRSSATASARSRCCATFRAPAPWSPSPTSSCSRSTARSSWPRGHDLVDARLATA